MKSKNFNKELNQLNPGKIKKMHKSSEIWDLPFMLTCQKVSRKEKNKVRKKIKDLKLS